MAGLALNSAVSRNPAMLAALYGVPIGAIVISLVMIKRMDRQRSGVSLFGRLTDTVGSAAASLVRSVMPRRKVAP
jgi:lipopolysaccharide export system permease protein